jgi:hypothetical protein
MVPTFTERSIGQGGTQLYPGSIATPTPQTFDAASPPPLKDGFGVSRHHQIPSRGVVVVAVHCIPAHIHQVRAGREVTGRRPLVCLRCTF